MKRFLRVIEHALKKGNPFTDAMIAGYTAVLCSPGFVCLEEKPGHLDDYALASRLSFFLWNSAPDDELRVAGSQWKIASAGYSARADRSAAESSEVSPVRGCLSGLLAGPAQNRCHLTGFRALSGLLSG